MLLELLLLGHIDSKWRKQETVAIAIMFSYRDSSLISWDLLHRLCPLERLKNVGTLPNLGSTQVTSISNMEQRSVGDIRAVRVTDRAQLWEYLYIFHIVMKIWKEMCRRANISDSFLTGFSFLTLTVRETHQADEGGWAETQGYPTVLLSRCQRLESCVWIQQVSLFVLPQYWFIRSSRVLQK